MTPRNISACAECGGTGKISYRTPSGDSVTTADGVTITDMGGYSTRPCACVKDLPVIVGHASWWTSESVYTETVPIPIGNEAVEITADCEVPRAENGRRLFRTAENAYYPPLVDVTTERDHLTLHADTARELALALLKAASACDQADELAYATVEPGGYGDVLSTRRK